MGSVIRGEFSPFSTPRSRLIAYRNGWGATAVDALSTALLMQIPEIVNDIVNYIPTINFDQTTDQISLFETTIRYLGGLLSGIAYPFHNYAYICSLFFRL